MDDNAKTRKRRGAKAFSMRLCDVALVLLLFPGALLAEDARISCSAVVDVPEPRAEFADSVAKPPLHRIQDLLELFSEGVGTLSVSRARVAADGVGLYPLPWRVAEGRGDHLRLVTWQDESRGNDESMLALVLQPGERWCSPPIERPPGTRLRFEAVSVGRAQGTLSIASSHSEAIFEADAPRPIRLDAAGQVDLPIQEPGGILCFSASKGPVAIGEPRLLAPEAEPRDPRARFVVLTILDAFRGDLLRRDDARDLFPSMSRLREEGGSYENVVAPGCHTRASVWPIFMGRDLMRIDPLQRRQTVPIQSDLEAIYSRANLFISHLAESAGYHAVFLGNNAYMRAVPGFSRYSSWGKTDTGTVDTIERLPALFARYADERVFLVYYVSAPHGQSQTPRRLYDALGCSGRQGIDECRCGYEARARHADEAMEALQRGIRAHHLEGEVVQFVTADHGELFGDGMKVEGEIPSFASDGRRAFQSFDVGHGNACSEKETDVPLVVWGKGIERIRSHEPVSGLDVAPTLAALLGIHPPGKLDGVPLALSRAEARPARPRVSYGFCSDSRLDGGDQLLWWVEGCRVREVNGDFLLNRAEIWSEGRRVATDETDPPRLRRAMERHEEWLRERLPSEAFVFETSSLGDATVIVTARDARIVDYGPSSTIYDLSRVEVLHAGTASLRVRFRSYRGLYHVSTLPPRASVRVEVEGRPGVLIFVGGMQLPLPVSGRDIDPSRDEEFLFAKAFPELRVSNEPALRLWWQAYGRSRVGDSERQFSDFERVLREWGYIR
jgi:hypothetical protein